MYITKKINTMVAPTVSLSMYNAWEAWTNRSINTMFKKHDKQYVEAHDKLDGETRIYMTDGH
jgi:hypothetical protein